MNIKDKVKLEKIEIDEIKNNLIKLKLKEEDLNKAYKELKKDKSNNIKEIKQIEKDRLLNLKAIEEMEAEITQKEDDLVHFAIHNGYDITTEDIAIILDSTTDYVTRKLKQEIEHINIKKFETEENILNFNKFNILEIYKLDQKSIFFYREDVKEFIKNHLFNVEEKTVKLNMEGIDLDRNTILEESKKYLKEKAKRYKFNTPVTDEIANKIMNKEIVLSKASTVRTLVYQYKVIKDAIKMKKIIQKIYKDNLGLIKDEVILEQYKLLNEYTEYERPNFTDKKISIIHDMQVQRYIKANGYTKYNFVYSNKALALFDTTKAFGKNAADEIEIIAADDKKLEIDSVENGILTINVPEALIHDNLENEIRNHLKVVESSSLPGR